MKTNIKPRGKLQVWFYLGAGDVPISMKMIDFHDFRTIVLEIIPKKPKMKNFCRFSRVFFLEKNFLRFLTKQHAVGLFNGNGRWTRQIQPWGQLSTGNCNLATICN